MGSRESCFGEEVEFYYFLFVCLLERRAGNWEKGGVLKVIGWRIGAT